MRIINATDYMKREGCKTIKERIKKIYDEMLVRGVIDVPCRIDEEPAGKPVYAEVNFGQWLARCECGGAEAVYWDEPIFYCCSCGNYANHGKPRLVVFPPKNDIKQIEIHLLERPIKTRGGTHYIERTIDGSRAIVEEDGLLPRSWTPDETINDLYEQNKSLKKEIKKAGKHG
ncbi:MAG TPA: hypothetical protein VMW53_07490 [archaeon]|nr:hypothetical protein [archaeon]